MGTAFSAARNAAGPVTDPIRVMVVDDSVVVRGLIGRWIDEEAEIAVVASHRNGRLAVDDVVRCDPDVVVLDIEMPEMDGLTALPKLLEKKPGLAVIIASTLTRRNAEISLRALSLGATDYVPKPETNSTVTTSTAFRNELIHKVKHIGRNQQSRARLRSVSGGARPATPARGETGLGSRRPFKAEAAPRPATSLSPNRAAPTSAATASAAVGGISLRAYSRQAPRVLAIGTSTGGPQALAKLFAQIGPSMARVPVLVTQHMPPTFTAILAEHIEKVCGRPAHEGRDGEELVPGTVYVAPGGKHMLVKKTGTNTAIRLTDDPPINFCKPAVDPLFESVATAFGSSTLALVLTGMGNDGENGTRAIARAGGSIIAQDEKTSVVWGMPGAAAHTGDCCDVLALDQIGVKVSRILGGERS